MKVPHMERSLIRYRGGSRENEEGIQRGKAAERRRCVRRQSRWRRRPTDGWCYQCRQLRSLLSARTQETLDGLTTHSLFYWLSIDVSKKSLVNNKSVI